MNSKAWNASFKFAPLAKAGRMPPRSAPLSAPALVTITTDRASYIGVATSAM